MAHQHDRSFELVERHRERLARRQVQVVGGLVKQQQVGTLPYDHAQHQPRLFASAHAAYRLLDHVAAEIEVTQKAAQVLLARCLSGDLAFGGHRPHQRDHVFQRRVRRSQHVEFLLCEVADVEPLALNDFASGGLERACHGLDQR